jgi:hypothetical protein
LFSLYEGIDTRDILARSELVSTDDVPPEPASDHASGSQGEPEQPLVVRSKKLDQDTYPDLDRMQTVVLKDGPRAKKNAKHTVILNRHTGEVHHTALVIETLRGEKGRWNRDDKHTICLTDEGEDEIGRLRVFLNSVHGGAVPQATADFVVLPASGMGTTLEPLQKLLGEATATGRIDIFADILQRAMQDADVFQVLLERAAKDPTLFVEAAVALKLAAYTRAVEDLEVLIAFPDVREDQFQGLLTKNPWMFGSEYSEILDRRRWTRDEQHDFVVRRTTDFYIELIEIKSPLRGVSLFNYDKSHDSYYPGAELSKVVGQVQKYLEKLDTDRDRILAHDGEDTAKVRAKIIVGRDGDEQQRKALRRFNGHLHRIEIITFDHLLRIARKVLSYLGSAINQSPRSV